MNLPFLADRDRLDLISTESGRPLQVKLRTKNPGIFSLSCSRRSRQSEYRQAFAESRYSKTISILVIARQESGTWNTPMVAYVLQG